MVATTAQTETSTHTSGPSTSAAPLQSRTMDRASSAFTAYVRPRTTATATTAALGSGADAASSASEPTIAAGGASSVFTAAATGHGHSGHVTNSSSERLSPFQNQHAPPHDYSSVRHAPVSLLPSHFQHEPILASITNDRTPNGDDEAAYPFAQRRYALHVRATSLPARTAQPAPPLLMHSAPYPGHKTRHLPSSERYQSYHSATEAAAAVAAAVGGCSLKDDSCSTHRLAELAEAAEALAAAQGVGTAGSGSGSASPSNVALKSEEYLHRGDMGPDGDLDEDGGDAAGYPGQHQHHPFLSQQQQHYQLLQRHKQQQQQRNGIRKHLVVSQGREGASARGRVMGHPVKQHQQQQLLKLQQHYLQHPRSHSDELNGHVADDDDDNNLNGNGNDRPNGHRINHYSSQTQHGTTREDDENEGTDGLPASAAADSKSVGMMRMRTHGFNGISGGGQEATTWHDGHPPSGSPRHPSTCGGVSGGCAQQLAAAAMLELAQATGGRTVAPVPPGSSVGAPAAASQLGSLSLLTAGSASAPPQVLQLLAAKTTTVPLSDQFLAVLAAGGGVGGGGSNSSALQALQQHLATQEQLQHAIQQQQQQQQQQLALLLQMLQTGGGSNGAGGSGSAGSIGGGGSVGGLGPGLIALGGAMGPAGVGGGVGVGGGGSGGMLGQLLGLFGPQSTASGPVLTPNLLAALVGASGGSGAATLHGSQLSVAAAASMAVSTAAAQSQPKSQQHQQQQPQPQLGQSHSVHTGCKQEQLPSRTSTPPHGPPSASEPFSGCTAAGKAPERETETADRPLPSQHPSHPEIHDQNHPQRIRQNQQQQQQQALGQQLAAGPLSSSPFDQQASPPQPPSQPTQPSRKDLMDCDEPEAAHRPQPQNLMLLSPFQQRAMQQSALQCQPQRRTQEQQEQQQLTSRKAADGFGHGDDGRDGGFRASVPARDSDDLPPTATAAGAASSPPPAAPPSAPSYEFADIADAQLQDAMEDSEGSEERVGEMEDRDSGMMGDMSPGHEGGDVLENLLEDRMQVVSCGEGDLDKACQVSLIPASPLRFPPCQQARSAGHTTATSAYAGIGGGAGVKRKAAALAGGSSGAGGGGTGGATNGGCQSAGGCGGGGGSGEDRDGSGGVEGGDGTCKAPKKPRINWSQELHARFLNAMFQLGIKNAVPKTILQLMNVEGLTRENVASHLQKYRILLKRHAQLPANAPLTQDNLRKLEIVQQAVQQSMQQSLGLQVAGGGQPSLIVTAGGGTLSYHDLLSQLSAMTAHGPQPAITAPVGTAMAAAAAAAVAAPPPAASAVAGASIPGASAAAVVQQAATLQGLQRAVPVAAAAAVPVPGGPISVLAAAGASGPGSTGSASGALPLCSVPLGAGLNGINVGGSLTAVLGGGLNGLNGLNVGVSGLSTIGSLAAGGGLPGLPAALNSSGLTAAAAAPASGLTLHSLPNITVNGNGLTLGIGGPGIGLVNTSSLATLMAATTAGSTAATGRPNGQPAASAVASVGGPATPASSFTVVNPTHAAQHPTLPLPQRVSPAAAAAAVAKVSSTQSPPQPGAVHHTSSTLR